MNHPPKARPACQSPWTGLEAARRHQLCSTPELRSFLDAGAAARWGIPLVEVSRPLVAKSLIGQRIGQITKATVSLHLLKTRQSSRKDFTAHHRHSAFWSRHSAFWILRHPWMVTHNPELDWKRHEILGWSPICSTRCLLKAHSATSAPRLEEAPNLAKVPVEYHDLKKVFCKSRATSLPPHRPYDCAIKLKPGTMPPGGCLFSLSQPSQLVSSALTHPPLEPDSSLWVRRTDRFAHASITQPSMTSHMGYPQT